MFIYFLRIVYIILKGATFDSPNAV